MSQGHRRLAPCHTKVSLVVPFHNAIGAGLSRNARGNTDAHNGASRLHGSSRTVDPAPDLPQ